MQVYGYIRVSTAEQAATGDSLDTQRNKVLGYALMQGWELADVYVESGVSGSVPLAERPAGAKLLGIVEKGDVIVTPKLDRMFRSASDALGTLEEIKAQGVGLVMLDLGGDVTSNGISKMVFTILSAVAEQERDRIRERIREVKRHLASKGVYGGGKAPFGWDVVGGRLVQNREEQVKIAQMIARRASGQSYREIGAYFGLQPMTVKRILDRVVPSTVVAD